MARHMSDYLRNPYRGMKFYMENPLLPAATVTGMRNRPSTKEWLDEACSAEEGGTSSKAPGWRAMISPGSELRENFEKEFQD